MNRLLKPLLIACGLLCVGLAVAGIVLPLLPTTPFLLLAAFLFTKSSERLYAWLLNHPWFGAYIRNYRDHRGMTLRHKIAAITLLWLAIGYSTFFVLNPGWLRVALLLIAAGVSAYLLSLNTLRQNDGPASRQAPMNSPTDQRLSRD